MEIIIFSVVALVVFMTIKSFVNKYNQKEIIKKFQKINTHYHERTFESDWRKDCGNGNKKLDEIQIFLSYLKNERIDIKTLEEFTKNFKYKERDIQEPGDLNYAGQVYQITHGNSLLYGQLQSNKNKEVLILSAKYITSEESLFMGFEEKLKEKEFSAKNNIILLIKIDRRNLTDLSYTPSFKIKTKWQDVVLVFNDANISIKNH